MDKQRAKYKNKILLPIFLQWCNYFIRFKVSVFEIIFLFAILFLRLDSSSNPIFKVSILAIAYLKYSVDYTSNLKTIYILIWYLGNDMLKEFVKMEQM